MLLFRTRSGRRQNGGFAWEKWHADLIGYGTEVTADAALHFHLVTLTVYSEV